MGRRILLLAAGLMGAVLLAQAPAFLAHYGQRLDERVAELDASIAEIERDVAANLGDGAALDRLKGRRDRLAAHGARLRSAPPGLRLVELGLGYDREVADGALFDFQLGPPQSATGALFALFGFVVGRGLVWLTLAGLRGLIPARRRS